MVVANVIISIVSFLGVLAVIIIAHELGHFTTAKTFGVKVDEFGLGFPPRLLSVRRGETLYSLNAIPLGGFTKMAGEEDPDVPRSLASKNKGIRLLVLGAGSLMNFLLPLLLFSLALMIPHDMPNEPVLVKGIAPNSPAAMAGIEAGDIILSIDDKPVRNIGELHYYIQLNLGSETTLLVKRNDSTTKEIQVIPRWKPPPEEGAIGVEIDVEFAVLNQTIVRQSYPFWEAIPKGVTECIETFVYFKNEIEKWIIGTTAPQVTGPVGIAEITGKVAQAGVSPLLKWAAFISINLAVINLFPLPALDGGRIVFVLLEWVRRGRRVSPRTEGIIHAIGFALLLAAMLAITYQDIARLVSGESLMP